MVRVLLFCALVMALCPGSASAKPRRIVSLHLCADQYLLEFADPAAILSVSYLARDPALSPQAEAARRVPVNRGGAEEALVLRPDLVLIGRYTAPVTRDLLTRFGVPLVEVDVPNDLDGVRRTTRMVTSALGEADRGEAAIAAMDALLERTRARPEPPDAKRPVAAVFEANGLTLGRGTLLDALMTLAGLDNLAARLNLDHYQYLGVERLVLAAPDLVIIGSDRRPGDSLGQSITRHRAIAALLNGAPPARLGDPALACPTPRVAALVGALARMRP